ncbi:hypothetical protein LEP1GSC202_3003 [Leptospira yanagawae serovar Saopaulo str. Sao Paulo = ATCC 700523]|uniref:Uncharacterized protein n=1 Tax=Leptospira yanagawae serovar Saopaulo str. Sao Paulo = ATCC 700523 TaxID=1249483 RepID=A0A5E8H9L9_9LEPT|nr:hypothetical protein [Leptospira yanagawae]EOQ87437.1 hypothetical protein LEP1GSC202_3003 [Leptospira yanagawae serovar Saopaulo str. Sao Paulo = ATCC 700523]
MIKKLFKHFQPHTVFFLDAFGASISLFVLFAVIVPFQYIIGMPMDALYNLGIFAGVLFFYSNTCFIQKPKQWKLFLVGVIIGNLSYCGLSMFFLIKYWNEIQTIGAYYFIWEKIVILAIVSYEGYILTKSKESLKA